MTNQRQSYETLKELLLAEEHEKQLELLQEVEKLREEIKIRKKLKKNVDPIIEERIDELRKKFPEEFGDIITHTIRKQIAESQDAMVDALYPILGQMIKKYIQKEIELLVERIEGQMNKTFKFSFKKSSKSDAQKAVSSSMPAQLNDVFVIENHSGILLGSYSKHKLVDKDMIAAMLTAIKQFVEDAFNNRNQNLEWIEYETYKIYIITFKRISVACTISGVPDKQYKTVLEDQVMEFTKEILPKLDPENETQNATLVNKTLADYFKHF